MATLCGLLLSMITLAYEVWQQKKQEKNKVHEIGKNVPHLPQQQGTKTITVGTKQVNLSDSRMPVY